MFGIQKKVYLSREEAYVLGELIVGQIIKFIKVCIAIIVSAMLEYIEQAQAERLKSDTGHAEINVITKVYTHILNEDRKFNAQKFETAFYSNPDLRNVKPPEQSQISIDLAALVEQLQKSPELASALKHLLRV